MITSTSSLLSPLALGANATQPQQQTAEQQARAAAVAPVPAVTAQAADNSTNSTYATTSASSAGGSTAGRPPAGGAPAGAPPPATTTEEEIDLATLARVRSLVGASEAENVLNDDGSINYQKLSETLAAQQQKAEASAARPTPVVDLFA